MAYPESKTEESFIDYDAYEYAGIAIKQFVRALAKRQANIDLNARVADNDNNAINMDIVSGGEDEASG